MNDDKTEDVQGVYLARRDDEPSNLANIPLPPDHVLKSSFLTAIKYRSVHTALVAYHSCIDEMTGIKVAQAHYNQAQIEELRTIELLMDAGTIHEKDKRLRDSELSNAKKEQIRAEEELEQIKHEAYLAKKQREVEKHNVDTQHAHLMQSSLDGEVKSKEDQEIKDYMLFKLSKVKKEQAIADEIRKEHKLSAEEDAILTELVQKLSTSSEA